MKKTVCVIDIPFTLGSQRRGTDLGPKAILHAGLMNELKEKEYIICKKEIHVCDDEDHKDANLKNVEAVIKTSFDISKGVSDIIKEDQFPLILGGDHSIAIGTIAGVANNYDNLGVIWVDAHGDLNTRETTPTGNMHGMPLAVNIGIGDERLTHLNGFMPKVKPENVILIGIRDLDVGEIELLSEKKITYYTHHDIERLGIDQIMEQMRNQFYRNGVKNIHLSFDLDVLDPINVKGVGTPVHGGMTFREASYLIHTLKSWNKLVSAEFVEVNPLFDNCNKTAEVAVALINELF